MKGKSMPRWRWLLREIFSRIWFRAALIAGLSVLLALAAAVLAPLIPYRFSIQIGAAAADNILTILASSMLAVTTFSLTAMVTAFSGAAQQGTPRATELLVEDKTAQNALSTFLGGFLFAIVGIIVLSTGQYGEQGRAVLLIGTIVMIVWIVVTLLGWIGRLTTFGRLADTIERVERKAAEALADYPGPRRMTGRVVPERPANTQQVTATKTGYVAHVDRSSLAHRCEEGSCRIHLASAPGTFAHPHRALAWIEGDEVDPEEVVEQFTVRATRDLDQDPRFGMVVLSEIASRALSPAVNDPGTAIAVLVAGQRVLDTFDKGDDYEPRDGLVDLPLSFEEMVEDLTLPIARDGAGLMEVAIHLQKTLGTLAERFPDAHAPLARIAADALERNEQAITAPSDLARVLRAHQRAFAD